MRNIMMAVAAASLIAPVAVVIPTDKAEASAQKRSKYREWRGRDGKRYCRKPDGTTGLVVGGVAGALVGRTIDTRGDRTLGTLVGAGAGAVAGRAIERGASKCR
ncbi:glycine zipper 2TM domain-containing protein [Sphingomonas sp. S1-29]|uniref:glycine zipper 2TM domain-containing protein n=1 Tax=Sphingomonas sp. S1-29 TaxID=2991074 RepID=UPI00223F23CD|nr:glycine zipper 2TM domain-containing protein [Sphingomonas sp. S1-29]UZK70878.1 glycine zipper 2TM domain-containing protein [Sphingomonas sp. S1-29]